MDMQHSSCIILMNLRILLQKLTVFSYKNMLLRIYIYIYKEPKDKIFNSLNNCLQNILELTPAN